MAWDRLDGLRVMSLGMPGEQRDWLNDCVLNGDKRATAGLLDSDYLAEGEDIEQVGELLPLVDSQDRRIATLEVTRVEVVPFGEVSWEFAQSEGEGFRDVEHWREVHRGFWAEAGVEVTADSQVVCTYFRLLP